MHLLLLLIGQLGVAQEPADTASMLAERWQEAREGSAWRSPTVIERERFGDGLRQLVFASEQCAAHRVDQAHQVLREAGFSVSRVQTASADLLVVAELAEHRRGGGFYVIRCGSAAPLVIQAPHALFDLHTREVAWSMFAEGNLRMGMWNTVHRYRSRPGEMREEAIHPADVCHEFGSIFQAATVAAATGLTDLRFVQLHGFSEGRTAADVIVSSGSAATPPTSMSDRLGDTLGPVTVFGVDASILGGTRNVQGRYLATLWSDRFLHLELSPAVRERLSKSPADRATLLQALEGAWR